MMSYSAYRGYISIYRSLGSGRESLLRELGYPPEMPDNLDDYLKVIDIIAAASDGDVRKLISLSGLTAKAFALWLGIPYRSVLEWSSPKGKSRPVEYVPFMIGYILLSKIFEKGD